MTLPEPPAAERSTPDPVTLPPNDVPNTAVTAALLAKGLHVSKVLGRGGHSVVYRARDERLAREVAVKVIDSTRAPRSAFSRFQREVAVVARLRHPNILPLYDAGIADDGSVFAVMPLAGGKTLRDFASAGALPLRTVASLTRDIADALEYAHNQGIIHRDIKPENILIEDEHAVVADFGLAMAGGDGPREPVSTAWIETLSDERLTATGSFVGTPLYASPEQVTGTVDLDARSDIFSLGAVCYEMITGVPPFRGATVQETLAARFEGPPPPMKQHGVRVAPEVEGVVLRALARSPAERQRSARVFRDELMAAFRATLTPSNRRRAVVGGLLTLLVGVGLGVAIQLNRRRATPPLPLDPTRVVVADFDNETADSAYARWGDVAGDIITTRLAQVPGLHVESSQRWLARREQAARQPDARASLRTVARETNAATVVAGGYYLNKGRIDLIVQVTDARTGDLIRTYGPVSVSPAAPDETVMALGTRVAMALDTLLVRPSVPRSRG
ncbi:MAG: serine/threonine-protein kinase [Gemmatimonadaceae bacterium]